MGGVLSCGMILRRVVVAADESDAGRQAVRTGVDIGARAAARVTVMHTVPISPVPAFAGVPDAVSRPAMPDDTVELDRLRRWLAADVLPPDGRAGVETAIAFGVPGVEICRYAEAHEADLLVLGRKPRSRMARLLLGDTADAVARRSPLPCLFVPRGAASVRRLLVALDGTDRGLVVLRYACAFARSVRAGLAVVTVEREPAGEPAALAAALPVERSARLLSQVRQILGQACGDGTKVAVDVRRGPIVEEVLRALESAGADTLVVGYHRGGPPGVIEAGSTARHLAHLAPGAVLTVPL